MNAIWTPPGTGSLVAAPQSLPSGLGDINWRGELFAHSACCCVPRAAASPISAGCAPIKNPGGPGTVFHFYPQVTNCIPNPPSSGVSPWVTVWCMDLSQLPPNSRIISVTMNYEQGQYGDIIAIEDNGGQAIQGPPTFWTSYWGAQALSDIRAAGADSDYTLTVTITFIPPPACDLIRVGLGGGDIQYCTAVQG